MTAFVSWPKIPRWANADLLVTEKIDGTNAAIVIDIDGTDPFYCQSRTRVIHPGDDNFGFAAWAHANEESLRADLGVGVHHGEWFGSGIQRKYGLDHKRFALFNARKWTDAAPHFTTPNLTVVPILHQGPMMGSWSGLVEFLEAELQHKGSRAVPGWMTPEGVVLQIDGHRWKITDAPQPKPRPES